MDLQVLQLFLIQHDKVHHFLVKNSNTREDKHRRSQDVFILVCDDGTFWGCFESPCVLHEIECAAAKYVKIHSSHEVTDATLSKGDLCIAPLNGSWSRAQICTLLTSGTVGAQAKVFYFDRGIHATLPLQRLIPLPLELQQHPQLAQLFTLSDVVPSCMNSVKWSEAVMHILRELTSTTDDMWVKLLADVGPGNVAILHCPELNVSINEYLVSCKLASPASLVQSEQAVPHKLPEAATSGKDDFKVVDVSSTSEQHFLIRDVSSAAEKQRTTIQHFQLPTPPKYVGVHVESVVKLKPLYSLESAKFPSSVCKELTSLGFRDPTPVQAFAWPYVSTGQNVIFIGPPSTGKTLAYLLPLLTILTCGGNTPDAPKGPVLVILVASSWQARSVYMQARKIMSWISVAKTFRCCCAYNGAEGEATHQLINGADVMVCTPPCLLKLMDRKITDLDSISHLVFDDGDLMVDHFLPEIKSIMMDILKKKSGSTKNIQQIVVAASSWSQSLEFLMSTYIKEVHIVTACAIEAAIRLGVEMKVLPCSKLGLDTALEQSILGKKAVICTSNAEEATSVYKMLQFRSWSATCVTTKTDLPASLSGIFIVSDEVLQLEKFGSVQHVVHYNLPSRKEHFRQRLALLYSAIQEGKNCSSTVLLTESSQMQSIQMKKLLERTGQPIPHALQEMVDISLKRKEEDRQHYDLCYHLKAWGDCRLERCFNPHKLPCSPIAPKLQPLQLPVDGSVKVKVAHVSNATRLWVSLLQHSPLCRGGVPVPSHDASTIMKLSLDLADYYAFPDHRQLHEDPSEGTYCGYHDIEGGYYRVRVLKFSQPLGLYFHHKEQARVRLIDVGCVQVVDVNQLLTLPEHFLQIPAQVIETFICGVRPCDEDVDWPEEAVHICQNLLQGKVLYGKVALSCGQTLWLDPVEHRVTLEGINLTTALKTPQQELIKDGLAEQNTTHLIKLAETLGIIRDHQEIDATNLSHVALPLNSSVEVYISAVISPDLFYVQLLEHGDSLDAIDVSLNDDQIPAMSSAGVTGGKCCVAKFAIDNRWYRGQVLSVDSHQSKVFFVDYGDTEWVPNNLVQPIDASLLQLPFQAIECSFREDGIQWSPDAGDLLWEWSRDTVFLAKAVAVLTSEVPGCTHYVVDLYENGETCSIKHRLPVLGRTVNYPLEKVDIISTSALEKGLIALDHASSEDEYLLIAERVQSEFLYNLSIPLRSADVLDVCKLLPRFPDSICLPLLRTLAGAAAFQKSVCEQLTDEDCVKNIMTLVKGRAPNVAELALMTLKMILPQSNCHTTIGTKKHIGLLCECLKSESASKKVAHVLDILIALLENDRKLSIDVAEAGGTETIPQLLLRSPSYHHPCLHLLYALVASKHEPVILEIRKHLPVGAVCQILAMEHRPEVIRLAVGLLQTLSVDAAFKQTLMANPLVTSIKKTGNSAAKCLLMQELHSLLAIFHPPPQHTLSGVETDAAPSSELAAVTTGSAVRPLPVSQEEIYCPKVLWSQSTSHVLLAVQLRGCTEKELSLESDSIHFMSCVHRRKYGFNFKLYAEIIVEASSLRVTGSEVLIKLPKKEHARWPQLTNQEKLPFIALDFDRWDETSSSEPDTERKPSTKQTRIAKNEPLKLCTNFLLPEYDTSSSDESESRDSESKVNDLMEDFV